jgi:hypothetical protein
MIDQFHAQIAAQMRMQYEAQWQAQMRHLRAAGFAGPLSKTALDDGPTSPPEPGATFVGSGEFKVDLDERKAKMKQNVDKIWRHRAGLVWSCVVKPLVFSPAGAVLGFSASYAATSAFIHWAISSLFVLGRDGSFLAGLFSFIAPGGLLLACVYIDSHGGWRKLKEGWNP